MAEVALRERIDADLGTLFEFQADPEASAMAAFPSRDLPAFMQREARIKADPSNIKRTIVAGGEVVGWIGSWEVQGERDVGFWIGRDHWGNGYATAALRVPRHRAPQAVARPRGRPQRRFQARAREVRLRPRPLGAGRRRARTRARADPLNNDVQRAFLCERLGGGYWTLFKPS